MEPNLAGHHGNRKYHAETAGSPGSAEAGAAIDTAAAIAAAGAGFPHSHAALAGVSGGRNILHVALRVGSQR